MELMPGYKQTEVGVIPEDWTVETLGKLGQAIIGLTYKPEQVADHGTLVLRSSNIQNCALTLDDNVYVLADIPTELMVQEGDVLVCVRNGSRDLIGKTALLDKRANGMTFGAFMAILRSPLGSLIHYHFQSSVLRRQISAHLGATINQITNKSLKSFQIILPPTKGEQNSIVEALQDVDDLIEYTNSLIDKKKQIKQAAMQELLTGKRRLPGFEGEWEMKRLGDVAPLQRGFDLPNPKLQDGPYPVVYSNGVMNHHAAFQVKGPGVATGRSGTIGKVHYVANNFWPHNTSLWVTDFRGNDPKFIFYLLSSMGIERFAAGSGVPTLNRNDLHDHSIRIPRETREQIAIAAVLTDLDTNLDASNQQLAKASALRQGMMQQLLTGKIRLT